MDICKNLKRSPWLWVLPLALLGAFQGCGGRYCDALGQPPNEVYPPITMVAGTTLTDHPVNLGGAATSLDVLPNPSATHSTSAALALPRTAASAPAAAAGAVQDSDLPAGIVLAADGTLTLLPTLPEGTYDIPVQFCNADGCETSDARITVTPPPALGLDYPSGTFSTGAPIPVQAPVLTNPIPALGMAFSVTAGALPPGLALQGDGTLTGTPTTAGTFAFTVQVVNGTRTATSAPVYTVVASTVLALSYPSPVTFIAGLPAPSQTPTLLGADVGVPTTFLVAEGTLPPGMVLLTDGSISGTPAVAGIYPFFIRAANGARTAFASPVYRVVSATTLGLGYPTPMTFLTGVAIPPQVPTLQGAVGNVPATFTLAGGALPPGLSLQANGVILGTPTSAGVFSFTVQAANSIQSATSALVYTVVTPVSLALAYPSPVTFIAGAPAPPQIPILLNADAGVPTSFALTAGTLPPGMNLQADGILTGTPTTAGVYPCTIQAVNGTLTATSSPVYTVIMGALGLIYPSPVAFQTDLPIPTQAPNLQDVDLSLPVAFALTGGTLPPGLVLQDDGTLTGTPTTPGVYPVTLQATNGSRTATAFPVYTVVTPMALVLIYPSPVTFIAGLAVPTQTPILQGADAVLPTTFSLAAGTLPPGLSLQPDGTITGTPTTGGVYPFTIEAVSDIRTATCSPVYTVVELSALGLNYSTPMIFQAGVAAAVQVPSVLNADPTLPLTFSLISDTLPQGMDLQPDGTITGTPTTPGVYPFTIQVTDALRTASTSPVYTVVPSQALALNYDSPVFFTAGTPAPAQIPGLQFATPGITTTFALTAGTLPPGMDISSTDGSITGTPTTPGVYPVTIQADNGTRSAVSSPVYTVDPADPLTLAYNTPAPYPLGSATVLTPTLQNTTPGVSITYQLAPGSLPLPDGLVLHADGTIDGYPTADGRSIFTIQVINGDRSATCKVINTVTPIQDLLLIYNNPMVFTAGSPAPTQSPIAQYLTPGVPASLAITDGALPSGLFIHGFGLIDGTPDTPGVGSFTVTLVNDTRMASFIVNYTVVPSQALTISYPTPLILRVNTLIPNQIPLVQNITPGAPITYSLVQGSLPKGLYLNPADGTISVTDPNTPSTIPTGPTQAGYYLFTIEVDNGTRSATCALEYTVVPAGPLTLNYPTPETFTVGVPVSTQDPTLTSVTPTITNLTPGIPETFTTLTGSLPPGLAPDANGIIQGTPTLEGVYAFTLQVQNGTRLAQADLVYTVLPAAPLGLSYPSPVNLRVGTPYSQNAIVTNDMPQFPDSFTLTGNLPAGLVLNPDGSISGTPSGSTPTYSIADPFTFTITLTNGPRVAPAGLVYRVSWPPEPVYAATTVLVGQTATILPSNSGGPIASAALSTGSLPTGATLNADGSIDLDGTTPLGIYSFQVNDCNPDGCVVADVSITVAGAPIAHYNAMAAFIGVALTDPPILATTSGPITSASIYNDPNPTSPFYSATLPGGLTLDPATGVITGTADATNPINKRWDVTLDLCNSIGCDRVVATLFTVMPQAPFLGPVQVLSAPARPLTAPAATQVHPPAATALPTAAPAEPLALPRMTYAETLFTGTGLLGVTPTAFGGGATWSQLLDGSLPLGMVLAPDGSLQGHPLWGGTYMATIRSGNAFGSTTAPLTLRVGPEAPALPGTAPVPAGAAGSLPAPAPDVSGWQLNGSADFLGDALRLTPAQPGFTGTAFWTTPVDARNLTVTFDAVMGGGTGGDGLSLILADADRGATAETLGRGFGGAGDIKGVGVVLDTLALSPEDPSTPFVGMTDGFHLLPGGAPIWMATSTATADLRSLHHVKVVVVDNQATVSIDGVPLIRQSMTFPARAYVGFGASTTAGTDAHDVSNISITWP